MFLFASVSLSKREMLIYFFTPKESIFKLQKKVISNPKTKFILITHLTASFFPPIKFSDLLQRFLCACYVFLIRGACKKNFVVYNLRSVSLVFIARRVFSFRKVVRFLVAHRTLLIRSSYIYKGGKKILMTVCF